MKAFHQRPHELDPVHYEEHEEAHLERHADEVLHLVARHELHRQLPRRLYDREDDKKPQAVRRDVARAGRDDLVAVVVDEIAEDRDLIDLRRTFGVVAAFYDLRLERLDDGR